MGKQTPQEDTQRAAVLDKARQLLGEFFDSVVIICSYTVDDKTFNSSRSAGNQFANERLIQLYADNEIGPPELSGGPDDDTDSYDTAKL